MTIPLSALKQKLLTVGGNVLVFQTAFLGDVVLITPLLRAIRRSLPRVRIITVTLPGCRDVVRGWADECLVYDKKNRSEHGRIWNELIDNLRREHIDVALIPHRSFRSGLCVKKAGISHRIGFDRGGGVLFHNHTVGYEYMIYEGMRNLKLLSKLIEVNDSGLPELKPSTEEETAVTEILTNLGISDGNFAVIAPASVWKTKQWPLRYYQEFATRLEKVYTIPALAIGGDSDREVCSSVVLNPAFNLAGKLGVLGSAALMGRAKFVVSGDTAPAHLATAVKARQVIIYGSTTPRFGFAPPTDNARIAGKRMWCRPCTDHGRPNCPLGNFNCLVSFTPDDLMHLVHDWVSAK